MDGVSTVAVAKEIAYATLYALLRGVLRARVLLERVLLVMLQLLELLLLLLEMLLLLLEMLLRVLLLWLLRWM